MKRVVRIAAIFLPIGAAMNFVVAWACWLWSPVWGGSVSQTSGRGAVWWIGSLVPDDWPARHELLEHNMSGGPGVSAHSVFIVPGFKPTEERPFSTRVLSVQRAGWPLLSVECHSISGRGTSSSHAPGTGKWRGAVAVPWLVTEHLEPRRMGPLPARPLWAGFIVNTVLYGGGWWALVCGPRAMRRWRRAGLGQCPGCGYDRRGLGAGVVCPECGEAWPESVESEGAA